MRFIFTAIGFLFISQLLLSQQLYVQKYPQEIYRASPQNWSFAKDHDGVIYVANNDGIIRYDGQAWGLLNLPGNKYVFSLAIDSSDNIFLGSYHELGYMHKQPSGIYKYQSLMNKLPAASRGIAEIQQTKIFHGIVFFNDMQNVLLYSNGKFKRYPIANRWLYEANDQLYLIVEKGLLRFNGKDFVNVSFSQSLKDIQIRRLSSYDKKTILLLDNKGKMWLTGLNGASDKLSPFAKEIYANLKDTVIKRILTLDNGSYMACSSKELVILDVKGRIINYVSGSTLEADLSLASFFEDRAHNLWMASNSVIIQINTSSPLSYYNKVNGLKGIIIAFAKYGTDLYVATSEGVFRKNTGQQFTLIPELKGQGEQFFNFDDKLYVAHDSGVYVYNGQKINKLIGHPYVQSLTNLKKQKNCLLFGTYNTGIYLMQRKGDVWTEKRIAGFEDEARYIREDSQGNIWISHNHRGIYKLRLNKALDSVISTVLYTTTNGLPSNTNNRLQNISSEEIRATTENGLYIYHPLKNRFEKDLKISNPLGPNFTIYSSTQSTAGDFYFWGAPSKYFETEGILLKEPNGNFKSYFTPFKKVLTQTNNLRVDVDAPQLSIDQDEVWIGNNEKIIVYRPKQKTYYGQPTLVRITEVSAGDSIIFSTWHTKNKWNIPFSQNQLKFQFVSDFNEDNEKLTYQYKIDGLDDHWSSWVHSNSALFTNLSEGDYRFGVKAKNVYGQISNTAVVSFHIDAPWYRTWWAYLMYAFILTVGFKTLLELNVKRIQKQKIALEAIIDEKVHELKNKNDFIIKKNIEIVAQSEKLRELNETKDKLFSIISHDLRGPIGQVDQTIKMIENGELSMEEFEAFLPELSINSGSVLGLLDNLLFWARGQLERIAINPTWFDMSDIIRENYMLFKQRAESKQITMTNSAVLPIELYADKDMMMLVMRNLINNAIKFTGSGGEIDIGVEFLTDHIAVFVKDTGIGMTDAESSQIFTNHNFSKYGTAGEKGTGLGLSLCKEFIERNGGTLKVVSVYGKGSTFYFELGNDKTNKIKQQKRTVI